MIELTDTTSSKIAAEFVRSRIRAGSPAMGMVMTLIIVAPEDDATEALVAAKRASREHPSRVLGVILGDARGTAHVNAQVGSGDGWGGEIAVIRLKGEVVKHAESVVLPLLLPDSPVAIWWPTTAPADPAADPLGNLAQRRITDAAGVSRGKSTAMLTQCQVLRPGQHRPELDPPDAVARPARRRPRPAPAEGHRRQGHRRADQPERRPARRLAVRPAEGHGQARATRRARASPRSPWTPRRGRSGSRAPTAGSPPSPPPNRPDRPVALKRREIPALLAEELRRLDEDDVYAATAAKLVALHAKGAK